jgi:long-chain acyl-CoA synthetase
VELQAQLEAQYGVALPDEAVQKLETSAEAQSLVKEFAQRAPAPDEHKYPHWPWSPWMQAIRAGFLATVAMPLLRFLAAPTIYKLPDNQARGGPFLIVANHITSYDAPFVLAALPGRLRRRVAIAMSGEMILDWRRGRNQGHWFLNLIAPLEYWLVTALFNIFPLPQRSGFRRSFQHAGEAVDRGYSVLVFPEGQRSEDGKPLPFKSGAGLLWKELGVPAIPVRIQGLGELKVAGGGWFRSGKIAVRAGHVLPPPAAHDTPESLTEKLRSAVFNHP